MGDGGAVGKGKDDDLENPYELLELEDDAGEKEIKTAYRKLSLKCHPDRNPDDPEAAEKFDRLTRAKDLLDCGRRSELDRKRKAARDLEERHAQEDAKRRKFREDLEGRETAANARSAAAKRAAHDAEARRKFLQQDMAQRIRAKEQELSMRQQEVAASAAEARETALDARLRLTWRGAAPSIESIRQELSDFDLKSMEVGVSSAIVQMGSRESALRAVLECRSRKNLSFKVAMAPKEEKEATEKPKVARKPSGESLGRSQSFDDWEEQMMADMRNLIKKKTAT
ncbi:unnamed protein product [Effrenium voratum]|uniref:J domain-containing protein n=1 Tax=Effrenium voratum TaxID=2562239 RepID=A0AA36J0R3_9DINO|nr:unnamed protein product [Effrenium voratum]